MPDADYKEIKVWHPLKRIPGNISPFLHTQGCRGEFKFDFSLENNRNLLTVSRYPISNPAIKAKPPVDSVTDPIKKGFI
jgi:hypothetical protein